MRNVPKKSPIQGVHGGEVTPGEGETESRLWGVGQGPEGEDGLGPENLRLQKASTGEGKTWTIPRTVHNSG